MCDYECVHVRVCAHVCVRTYAHVCVCSEDNVPELGTFLPPSGSWDSSCPQACWPLSPEPLFFVSVYFFKETISYWLGILGVKAAF